MPAAGAIAWLALGALHALLWAGLLWKVGLDRRAEVDDNGEPLHLGGQVRKQLAGTFSASRAEVTPVERALRKELKAHEADLRYIRLFPRGTPYVGLFAKPKADAAEQTRVVAERARLRGVVEAAFEAMAAL